MTDYSRSSLSSRRSAAGLPPQYRAASASVRRARTSALDVAAPRWQVKPILVATALLVLGLIILNGMHNHAAAEKLAITQQQQQAAAARQQAIGQAIAKVRTIVADYPQVSFSIDAQNLGGRAGDRQHVGNDDAQDAGSIGKLVTATTWLKAVENGEQSGTVKLGGLSSTSLLKAMIVNSDDQAWQLLNDRLTHPTLQQFAANQGFTDYDADSNVLTSSSVSVLLAKLWNGQLVNKADSQQLLGYMKQANYRDYIVAGAPKDAVVYHKVGIDGDHVNDAAIITKANKTMSLVIMTDGHNTYNWPQRAQAIQQITAVMTEAYL